MKKSSIALAASLTINGCAKREQGQRQEIADSANEAHLDSPATGTPTVMTEKKALHFFVNAANEGMTGAVRRNGPRGRKGNGTEDKESLLPRSPCEHADMINEVKNIQHSETWCCPKRSPDNRKKIDELSLKKPRKEFDRAYLDVVIKDREVSNPVCTRRPATLVNDLPT